MTVRLEKALRELSPAAVDKLTRLAEEMAANEGQQPAGRFELKWAGALAQLGEKYGSVELQHEASRWRAEEGA
jgi:plasmid stabilization system protein ParE